MLAKDVMSTDVLSVREDQSFNQVELLAELKNVRHIPVVDDDHRLVGIVSLRDLLSHLSNAAASHFVPVTEIMESKPVTVSPDLPLQAVAEILLEKNIGCVPVLENEKLVGIISDRDFTKIVANKR